MITDTITEEARDQIRQMQGEIERLTKQLVSARHALTEMTEAFQPFASKPMGAPNSDARIQQQLQIAAHRNAKAALTDD